LGHVDNDYEEWGVLPEQGRRSDLQGLYEATREGKNNSELWAEFPGAMLKYHKSVDRLRLDLSQGASATEMQTKFGGKPLREWQSAVVEKLDRYEWPGSWVGPSLTASIGALDLTE